MLCQQNTNKNKKIFIQIKKNILFEFGAKSDLFC